MELTKKRMAGAARNKWRNRLLVPVTQDKPASIQEGVFMLKLKCKRCSGFLVVEMAIEYETGDKQPTQRCVNCGYVDFVIPPSTSLTAKGPMLF